MFQMVDFYALQTEESHVIADPHTGGSVFVFEVVQVQRELS